MADQPHDPQYRRLRRFSLGGSDLRRAIDDEIASHLEHTVRELVASGMDPREAEEEALRRFGPVEEHREACLASAARGGGERSCATSSRT